MLLFAASGAACRTSEAQRLPPTATAVRVVQTTPVPTIDRLLQPIASPSRTPAPLAECTATAGQPAVQHRVEAEIDYAARRIRARQQTTYINRTNETLTEIVFSVEPNRIPNAFALTELLGDDGIPVPSYELAGRRLEVALPQPLAPGCTARLHLAFEMAVPPIGRGISAFHGYFGYSARQLNLGHWLPVISFHADGAWITHDVAQVGEQIIAEVADWRVELSLVNAPESIQIAAPGRLVERDEQRWVYVQTNAREWSLSLSADYIRSERMTSSGVLVELYSFEDAIVRTESGPVDAAAHALEVAARSLAMFSDLYGAYPHERFVVVQGDFPDGMEFSDLIFVSGDWFRTYTGNPASYLTIITVHEVAHQWWYARVGSDQALTPWLDEALATYSEYVFFEEYYPALRDWWWSFRVANFVPSSFTGAAVDSTVYEFDSVRQYINAVYLRGAQMMDSLRRDLGTDAFFHWLRRYAAAATNRVATPDLFWSLLTPQQLEQTAETRLRYLSQPALEVLGR